MTYSCPLTSTDLNSMTLVVSYTIEFVFDLWYIGEACELRDRLGLEDVVTILQCNRLRWYGHVLRKDDSEWVKKCVDFVVEGVRPRGNPKRT